MLGWPNSKRVRTPTLLNAMSEGIATGTYKAYSKISLVKGQDISRTEKGYKNMGF